jgi:hypothetical protein
VSTKDIRHPSNRAFHILGASFCIISAALLLVAAPGTSLLLAAPGLNHLPLIVAHRGGDEAAPETSLQSFQAAANADFPLEMDLRPLSDSGIAISHDASTGGAIKSIRSTAVAALSSQKWSSLCLTAKTSACYRPTTLTQVLTTFAPSVPMIIENKEADVTTSRLEAIITQAHRTATTLVESLDINEIKKLSGQGFHTLYVVHKNQHIDMAAVAQAGTDVLAVSFLLPLVHHCEGARTRRPTMGVDGGSPIHGAEMGSGGRRRHHHRSPIRHSHASRHGLHSFAGHCNAAAGSRKL